MPKIPKIVFSIYSPINGILKVVDTISGRELRSGNDFYVSIPGNHRFFSKRYWGIYLEEVRKLRLSYKKVLCLGLGGGSIQNELFKLYPGVEIVTIELDPLINDIYKYYFSGDKFENHKILNLDAKVFLKHHHRFGNYENYFDLIFVDVFSSMNLDEFEKIKKFISDSKKLLKNNGIFSLNVIVQNSNQFEESKNTVEIVSKEFKDVNLTFTSGFAGVANLLIFGSDKIKL
jgi:spermidine synthase